jgi:hypothetical protein
MRVFAPMTAAVRLAGARGRIEATFQRRGTPLPIATPYAFTKAFDERKEQEWKRFLTKNNLPEPCRSLGTLIETINGICKYLYQT